MVRTEAKVFQIYVDADSVRALLREPSTGDYNQYIGDETSGGPARLASGRYGVPALAALDLPATPKCR